MKRKVRLLLSVTGLILLFFSGCSGGESSRSNPSVPEDKTFVQGEWIPDGVIGSDEYASSVSLSGFTLRFWTDDEFLYMAIQAPTEGWVSVGFAASPDSGMEGADLIFGKVEAGATIMSDQFSTGKFGPHSPDNELGGTDDILESGGRETDGVTVVEFKRRLNTGDGSDLVFSPDSSSLIVAYGKSDDLTEQHAFRGALLLNSR